MTARPDPTAFALDSFLRQAEQKSLLRFVACGSVDHGKSTLIGRLLYEAKLLHDDQLDALQTASRKHGTQGKDLDFALLLDGLAAEREQKITIDVAYRFFTTERRKFIVADAPGHEQYTRNMATGASTADLALILINAEAGLTRQTKRHSVIVSMLGVRHLLVAVNKMDLVGWSEQAFRAIEAEYRAFASDLGVSEIVCIPISARSGDNVVERSAQTEWYRGPTLLQHLEQVEVAAPVRTVPFRMPVQMVARPTPDFRGYGGMIFGGEAYPGMPVRVLPSGQTSQISRIVTYDGDLQRAGAGRSVTITLTDEIDVSRGDVIAEVERAPIVADRLASRIVWMGAEPLVAGRSYLLKLGTSTAKATVASGLRVLDLETRASIEADRLVTNDIGHCTLALDRPLAVDPYAESRQTGSFILIDPENYDTVGMGIVEAPQTVKPRFAALRRRIRALRNAPLVQRFLGGSDSHLRSVVKAISWRTTGSIDTFLVTLVITRSTVFASSVAGAEIITKIMLYYFHERVWAIVPWGRR